MHSVYKEFIITCVFLLILCPFFLYFFPFVSAAYFVFCCPSRFMLFLPLVSCFDLGNFPHSRLTNSEDSATYEELCGHAWTGGRHTQRSDTDVTFTRRYTGNSRCTECGHPSLWTHNATCLDCLSTSTVSKLCRLQPAKKAISSADCVTS